jgi:hypothetical protein
MSRKSGIGIAARSRQGKETLVLGQQQIQNLRGLDFQHAFLEEKSEWIRILVTRDLQNSFIDCQNNGLGRFGRR